MFKLLFVAALIAVSVCGCSSDPQDAAQPQTHPQTQAADVPSQPAAQVGVHTATEPSSSGDVVLMAEYLLFTRLADSVLYQPMNDTSAMIRLLADVDMSGEGASTSMMRVTAKYLHKVLSDAILPMQQFGGVAKSSEVKHMATVMVEHLQQMANLYLRALKVLEEAGTGAATPEQMQKVSMILSGGKLDASKLRYVEESAAVYAAAHRALGR